MTREELKAHCEKQIENCEMWAKYKGEEPHGKVYEEHKLILELLEQEPTIKNDCAEQNGCISCSLDDGDDCCRKLYEESMQEPTTKNEAKYCDRSICLKNEYNNVGCEDCEVTKSQEPFINKPCVSSEVCEHDKNKVLNKIRAEIDEISADYTNVVDKELLYKDRVLGIIDKYKAESENA